MTIKNKIGILFIVVGLACNEWVLKLLFSSDNVLEPRTRIIILSFEILVISTGVVIYKYARPLPKFVLTIILNVCVFLVLIFCFEILFYFLNNKPNLLYETISLSQDGIDTPRNQVDELLGYKPTPNIKSTVITKLNGKEIINRVNYLIDEYSRRIVPINNPGTRNKFILFFGGSFTLGAGVNDDENMPYYVSRLAPQYMPYNYGYHGYGPHQMLAKLESNQLRKEINEQEGILIYTFIGAHVNRAIGSMHSLGWGSNTPFYSIDDSGNLIKGSSFSKSRPLLSSIYNILSLSQIVKYYQLDFPLYITNKHINLTCRLIAESARHFEKQFNSKKFYVLLYPTSKYSQRIGRCLQDYDVTILDYSKLVSKTDNLVLSKYDTHPNARAYRILSRRIVEDLGLIDDRMEEEPLAFSG